MEFLNMIWNSLSRTRYSIETNNKVSRKALRGNSRTSISPLTSNTTHAYSNEFIRLYRLLVLDHIVLAAPGLKKKRYH